MDHAASAQAGSAQDSELLSLCEACVLRFPAAMRILPGQSHPHVYLAQAMFRALHSEFPEFSPVPATGRLEASTSENLRRLQACSCLPESGELDKKTWNRLARLYRAVFDRYRPPSYG